MAKRRVIVITADSLAPRMAGPAIRAFEIAKALSQVTEVTLISTVSADLAHPDFDIAFATDAGLRRAVHAADVIVFQGHIMASHSWIADTDKIIVADIYDPMHLEQLEQVREKPIRDRIDLSIDIVSVLNDQLKRADFLICASEKQRDFWLGQLAGLGRINPATYDSDTSLRNFIDVVPFGVQDAAPVQKRHAIKGAVDGITADDKVILWGGGIYNWFDPLTLIRAVHDLSRRHDNVRLFFLGAQHPNPHVPAMQMVQDARDLVSELDLEGKHVFFNEGWVPYDERADYLLDADLGVSTHLDHLETAFSFRTRILDYLWCSLPIVTTDGDTFADLTAKHNLGEVVPPQDVEALSAALERVLFDGTDEDIRHNVADFALSMHWRVALRPLIDFCLTGERAADKDMVIKLKSERDLEIIQRRLAGVESSTSWRLMRPVRALIDRVRPQRK